MKPADIKRARSSLQTERARLVEEQNRFLSERQKWDRERPRLVEALKLITSRFGSDDWSASDNLADVVMRCLLDPLVAREDEQARQLSFAQERIRRLLVQVERAPQRPVPLGVPVLQAQSSPRGHQTEVEQVKRQGVAYYRATCECGWRYSVSRIDPRAAAEDAGRHALGAARSA